MYTQLRISAHRLSVETGRHRHICRTDRICLSCNNNAIEDEEHFLLHCPKFESRRRDFFSSLSGSFPNFQSLCDSEKMFLILSEPSVCQSSAKYITDIYLDRA